MPDPIVQLNPMDPETIEAHNKDIARRVAAQDAAGHSTAPKPGEAEPAISALDKLFQEKEEQLKKAAGDAPAPVKKEEAAAPVAEPPATPAAPVAPEPTAEQKRAEEIFKDSPKLPQGASPKSADAFNFVKTEAAKKIMDLESQLTKLKEDVDAERKRASTPTTEQLEKDKEYQELRNWRAKIDLKFNPEFKKFDQQVAEASEFVYAQLRKSPAITDEHINLIKKFGGPHKINLQKLFEAVKDPSLQRLVEAQVSDMQKIEYQKERAVAEAEQNIEQFTQEREKHWKEQATAHTLETQKQLDGLLGSLDWFAPKKPADNASAEEKKSAEAHNAFLGELGTQIQGALQEDTPQMRAVLIAGMAQLFNLQRVHAATKSALEVITKERDTILEKLNKIKASATTRLREGSAPAEGMRPAKPVVNTKTRTDDAVDALAKQVMEERQAKGLPV